MEPTSIKALESSTRITYLNDGFEVQISANWIIQGEDRLSYATVIRLIECCREHHWNTDVVVVCGNKSDSICRAISGEFLNPIFVGQTVRVRYRLVKIGNTSYTLRFFIESPNKQTRFAIIDIVSVFYDPNTHCAVKLPPQMVTILNGLGKID